MIAAEMTWVTLASKMARHGFVVAGLDRVDQPPPAPDLLADALVDQHVGVDRGADGQDEAGDARQASASR